MFKDVLALLFTCTLVSTSYGQVTDFQVNPPLVGSDEVLSNFSLSNDGEKVFYTVGFDEFAPDQLFSTTISSKSAPVLLNSSASTINKVISVYSQDANSSNVAFVADGSAYAVAGDGSNERFIDDDFSLNPFLTPPQFGVDSEAVFYTTLLSPDSSANGIFKKSINTGGVPIRLDTQPNNSNGVDIGFYLTSDSQKIVYAARSLNTVSTNSGSPVRLDEHGVDSFFFRGEPSFGVSPDETMVVFRSLDPATNKGDIYSVPIDGGDRVLLNIELGTAGRVRLFEITPDSKNVIYVAAQSGSFEEDIYIVPISGGQSQKLNDALVPNGRVSDFLFDVSNNNVIYKANQISDLKFEYYSVSLDTLDSATQISPSVDALGDMNISQDGVHFAFKALRSSDNKTSIYIGKTQTMQYREIEIGNHMEIAFRGEIDFSNANDFLIYVATTINSSSMPSELYASSISGGLPRKISREFVDNEEDFGFARRVGRFKIPKTGNRVIYRADIRQRSLEDLFSVDISRLKIEEDDEICVPIKPKNFGVSVICI